MAEPSLESIFSPEIIENPYPMYQALREGSPVLELPDANMLVLTRYEDIQTTLRDRTLGHADDSMMTEAQLADILFHFGEERASRRIAKAIVKGRAEEPITTTLRLAEIIESCLPRPKPGQSHPATRSFQTRTVRT